MLKKLRRKFKDKDDFYSYIIERAEESKIKKQMKDRWWKY